MFHEKINDYFEGVAAKYLSAVDAEPSRSNQHEIGGLIKAGFGDYLGRPPKGEKERFAIRMVHIRDDDSEPLVIDDEVSWYDSRHAERSPEYRLYYKRNEVTEQIAAGDFMLVGKLRTGALLLVFTPAGSTIELQLRAIFGITGVSDMFSTVTMSDSALLLPLQMVLEDLGIVLRGTTNDDEAWLGRILARFDEGGFPTTSEFSLFARETAEAEFSPKTDPDSVLLAWMSHEEMLFRLLERHLVKHRLAEGFGVKGDDVDSFIAFSLSVQNRRKSRVGRAFENHLSFIFLENQLRFEQGGKGRVTENQSKPDFLFPGFHEYALESFPTSSLRLLGAKTTCKDRWRQVLSEGKRIVPKHLITLEAAISEAQTAEMRASNLKLVVPVEIQITYSHSQQQWLMSLAEFIEEVKGIQRHF